MFDFNRYKELEQWIEVEPALRSLAHDVAVEAAKQPQSQHEFNAEMLESLITDLFPPAQQK